METIMDGQRCWNTSELDGILLRYQQDKTTVRSWKKALFDEAGVVMEMPIDPLTQTSGSMMTGL